MTAFPGILPGNIKTDLLTQVLFTAPGFPFTNVALSFESMNIGMRKGARLIREAKSTDDVAKRPNVDRIALKIEAEPMQTSLATLLNCYLLSKQPIQARLKTVDGQYFNIIDNTSLLSTPTGPGLISLGWEMTFGTNERTLKLVAETEVGILEWQHIVDNSAAAATGGASGTSLGLTEVGYDKTAYKRFGLQAATFNDENMGTLGESKITYKSSSHRSDLRQRPYNRFIEVTGELTILQTGEADMMALADNLEHDDGTLAVTTWEGETLQFTDGAAGFTSSTTIGDGMMESKVMISGEIPYNPSEGTPAYFDCGVTDPAILECRLAAYS